MSYPTSPVEDLAYARTGTPRRVEVADIPWMLKVGAAIFPDIDKEDTAQFLYYAMSKPNFLVVRTDNAFGCFITEPWPFNTELLHCYEIFLASEQKSGWDVYNIAKQAVAWAQKCGCDIIQFQPKTSLDPIMKRLGFVTEQPSYRLNLKAVH